ncbi:MAG: hypothetical protein KAX28_01955, partial [Candidatus Marinimicrobia bacterium]|nr:hypothetical protein [Candidatus Neomarinimicrobiota bacterium]
GVFVCYKHTVPLGLWEHLFRNQNELQGSEMFVVVDKGTIVQPQRGEISVAKKETAFINPEGVVC